MRCFPAAMRMPHLQCTWLASAYSNRHACTRPLTTAALALVVCCTCEPPQPVTSSPLGLQGVFGALSVINSFPSERVLVLRERAAGTYSASAYFIAKSSVDLVMQVSPQAHGSVFLPNFWKYHPPTAVTSTGRGWHFWLFGQNQEPCRQAAHVMQTCHAMQTCSRLLVPHSVLRK
jgi:hypothetical protein